MKNVDHSNPDQNLLLDLLDDCVTDEAIESLLANEQQAKAWYRHHTISSALKQQHSAYSSYQFTQAIAAKISNEPAIIAIPKPLFNSTWKKVSGGFAIAASVAFVMIFSVQLMDSPQIQNFDSVELKTQAISPTSSGSSINETEQAKLDEIQRIIDRMNQRNLTANEQLVGGETMAVQSFIIKTNKQSPFKTNNQAISFAEIVKNMKKPSESQKKN